VSQQGLLFVLIGGGQDKNGDPSSTVIGIFGLHQSAKLLILDKADLLDPEKA
jgi:hypothetical protein